MSKDEKLLGKLKTRLYVGGECSVVVLKERKGEVKFLNKSPQPRIKQHYTSHFSFPDSSTMLINVRLYMCCTAYTPLSASGRLSTVSRHAPFGFFF